MGYPNSPVDPEIVHWGWPWHGRIESPTNSAMGTLRLPSGATMPCGLPAWSWTHLWDIGMPPPEIESDNPDEQWLNRAIIRAPVASGGTFAPGAWYGGANNRTRGAYPMYVPGAGTFMRRFDMVFDPSSEVCAVTISVFGLGPAPVTQEFTLQALGLDVEDATVNSVQTYPVDHSASGDKMLVVLVPYRTELSASIELFGRAVIELSATVTDGVLALGLRVVSRYSDRQVFYENGFASDEAQSSQTMGRWLSKKYDEPAYEGLLSEGPPDSPWGWEFAGRWPIGSNHSTLWSEAVVWAWYTEAGDVELVTFRMTQEQTCEYDCTWTSRAGNLVKTYRHELSAGGRSAALEMVQVSTLSGDQLSTLTVGSTTVNGEELSSRSETADFPITRHDPGYVAPELIGPMTDAPLERGYLIVSNKLVAPYMTRLSRNPEASAYEDWAGDALHPGGVDAGVHVRLSTESENARNRWPLGSFNPITGQVVRHLRDLFCTWV